MPSSMTPTRRRAAGVAGVPGLAGLAAELIGRRRGVAEHAPQQPRWCNTGRWRRCAGRSSSARRSARLDAAGAALRPGRRPDLARALVQARRNRSAVGARAAPRLPIPALRPRCRWLRPAGTGLALHLPRIPGRHSASARQPAGCWRCGARATMNRARIFMQAPNWLKWTGWKRVNSTSGWDELHPSAGAATSGMTVSGILVATFLRKYRPHAHRHRRGRPNRIVPGAVAGRRSRSGRHRSRSRGG